MAYRVSSHFIKICLSLEHSNGRFLNLSCYYTVANRWRVFLFGLFGLVFGVFSSTKFGRSLLTKYPEFFSAGIFQVGILLRCFTWKKKE